MTLAITAACVAFTARAMTVIPPAGLPPALEFWMLLGWVTGLYLSMTAVTVRYLVDIYGSESVRAYFAVSHALQLPIVIGGVGTWAVVKALGWL